METTHCNDKTHASIKQPETKLFSAVHIYPVSLCLYKTNTTTSVLLPQQNHSPVFISHSLRHNPYHPTPNLHSRISSNNFLHSAQSHFSTHTHTRREKQGIVHDVFEFNNDCVLTLPQVHCQFHSTQQIWRRKSVNFV